MTTRAELVLVARAYGLVRALLRIPERVLDDLYCRLSDSLNAEPCVGAQSRTALSLAQLSHFWQSPVAKRNWFQRGTAFSKLIDQALLDLVPYTSVPAS